MPTRQFRVNYKMVEYRCEDIDEAIYYRRYEFPDGPTQKYIKWYFYSDNKEHGLSKNENDICEEWYQKEIRNKKFKRICQ